jgi:hypothetical protein
MSMQLAIVGILVVLAARLPVWIPATIALLGFALLAGLIP